MHRIRYVLLGCLLAGGFYLLLIDTVSSPELYAGAVVTLLAALAYEAAREEGFAEARFSLRWLARLPQLLLSVPRDVWLLSVAALVALASPRRAASGGRFRAVPFASSGRAGQDAGRRALAEAFGSLTPNTIVLGVDPDRELLLAHQLRPSGGRDALDPLRLGHGEQR